MCVTDPAEPRPLAHLRLRARASPPLFARRRCTRGGIHALKYRLRRVLHRIRQVYIMVHKVIARETRTDRKSLRPTSDGVVNLVFERRGAVRGSTRGAVRGSTRGVVRGSTRGVVRGSTRAGTRAFTGGRHFNGESGTRRRAAGAHRDRDSQRRWPDSG